MESYSSIASHVVDSASLTTVGVSGTEIEKPDKEKKVSGPKRLLEKQVAIVTGSGQGLPKD